MIRGRIKALISGMTLGVLLYAAIAWGVLHFSKAAEAPSVPPDEICWSGTLAVQLPEYPEYHWVNYEGQTNSQVQICGVGLRVGDIQAFPDYSATIRRLEKELEVYKNP